MELDLLEENKVFGKNSLSIFAKHVAKASNTDFSILLGGDSSSNYHTREGNTLKNRAGWWWTKSLRGDAVRIVGMNGYRSNYIDLCLVESRNGGIRPILSYPQIQSISSNVLRNASEIKEVECGEYPQNIVDENYSRELERAYNNGSLKIIGKNYTTDSVRYQDSDVIFKARVHAEYEYNGQKYIRFVGDSNGEGKILSNDRKIKKGKIYWVKVEPITWLVDLEHDIAITEKIIVSGIQFNNESNYTRDFKNTDIYKFMNTYLIKDMFNNTSINKEDDNNKEFVNIDSKIKTLRKRIDNIRK